MFSVLQSSKTASIVRQSYIEGEICISSLKREYLFKGIRTPKGFSSLNSNQIAANKLS